MMDVRYCANPEDFKRYTTEQTRREFLIDRLFVKNEVMAVYSYADRIVTLGVMPVVDAVPLSKDIDTRKLFGSDYFLERRELGIFNLGGAGQVIVDGETYQMTNKDCLYLTRGTRNVFFCSSDSANLAKFYMVSAPAHCSYENRLIKLEEAIQRPAGSVEACSKRTIYQFIHPDVLNTCQLSMGMTMLEPGSVWNAMPVHTHDHRMEIYYYCDIPEDSAVFHLMGQGDETRHIVVHNDQAVISPSWSIHAGAGTSQYTIVWAMGGENKDYDDMDLIPISQLR